MTRIHPHGDWRIPAAVIAVVLALVLAALVIALIELSIDANRSARAAAPGPRIAAIERHWA